MRTLTEAELNEFQQIVEFNTGITGDYEESAVIEDAADELNLTAEEVRELLAKHTAPATLYGSLSLWTSTDECRIYLNCDLSRFGNKLWLTRNADGSCKVNFSGDTTGHTLPHGIDGEVQMILEGRGVDVCSRFSDVLKVAK